MNGKRAKAIRKHVRVMGFVKADFPVHHVMFNALTQKYYLSPEGSRVVTARYPDRSFQRAYKVAKQALASVRIPVINRKTLTWGAAR